ncbi:MAG: methyltransferase [Cyclobacteriaceae bacterium]
MGTLAQSLTAPIRSFIRWYLKKPRSFTYNEIKAIVLPGVFHPGFFHSTKILLDYLSGLELKDQTFLEIGSGTGVISVCAALRKAKVTAIDISPAAVENTFLNQINNKVEFTVLKSDLFEKLDSAQFDWVVINPPYYPSKAQSDADYAWYCGEGHEYFHKLFSQLRQFIHAQSQVLIVLSEVCDLDTIFSIGRINSFEFDKILEKKVWVDGHNYLFLIKSIT